MKIKPYERKSKSIPSKVPVWCSRKITLYVNPNSDKNKYNNQNCEKTHIFNTLVLITHLEELKKRKIIINSAKPKNENLNNVNGAMTIANKAKQEYLSLEIYGSMIITQTLHA